MNDSTPSLASGQIMQFLQSISGDLSLNGLLAKILAATIDLTIAERGAIVLLEQSQLQLVKAIDHRDNYHRNDVWQPLVDQPNWPIQLIQTVFETAEIAVNTDVIAEPSWLLDPYLVQCQPQSVLGLPLFYQNRPIGVLYLEHTQHIHLFSAEKIKLLQILGLQSALALVNAQQYNQAKSRAVKLEKKVHNLNKKLRKERQKNKIIEAEKGRLEAQIQRLNDSIPVMLHSIDREGKLVNVNQYWLDKLGYHREEVIGRKSIDFLTQESRRYATEVVLPKYFSTGVCRDIPYQFVCKNGSIIDGLLSAFAEWDEAGNIVRSLAVTVDMTEHNRTASALRQSEQHLQLTLELAQIGVWEWHPETGAYRWSGTMHQLLELPKDLENMYQAWRDRIHAEDVDRVEQSIQKGLVNQSDFVADYRYHLDDGRVVWRLLKGRGLYTSDGHLERVLGVVLDINDRKLVTTLLHQNMVDLLLWQNRYDAASRVSGQILYEWDSEFSRPICWGTNTEKILGYCYSEMPETLDEWVAQIHPDDRHAFVTALNQSCIDQSPLRLEYQVRRKDGSYIWIHDQNQPVFDDTNTIYRVIGALNDITDLKLAHDALWRSQQQYQSLVNSVNGVVWEADPATLQFIFVSPQAELLLGYPLEQWLEANFWYNQTHPEDQQWVQEFCRRKVQIRQDYEVEYRVVKADGSTIWVQVITNVILEADRVVALRGLILNINDRKQAEASLRASEAKNQAILTAIPDLLLRVHRNGTCLDYIPPLNNKSKPSVLLPSHISEVIPPTVLKTLLKGYERALITGELQVIEHQLLEADQVIYEEVRIAPCSNDEVLVIVRNISDRRRAEEALYQSHKELSDFKSALNQAAIVAITNLQGKITYVNDHFCEISQYHREELLGKTHKIVNSGYHPPIFFQDLWSEIVNGIVWRGEIKNRAKDGSEYWVDTVIVPFLDDQGQPFQYLAIYSDITNRKRQEQLLLGQRKVLESLAKDTSLIEVLELLIRIFEEQLPGMLGAIRLLEEDYLWCGAAPHLPRSFVQAMDGLKIGPQAGSCGRAAYRQETVIVTDIANDPIWHGFCDAALQHGFQSCWSAPILSTTGKTLGTFCMYYPDQRVPTAHNLDVMKVAVNLAGLAIERRRTELELQRNRNFLQTVLDHLPVSLFVKDGSEQKFGQIILMNLACERLFGMSAAECLGKTGHELFPPEQAGFYEQKDRDSFEQGIIEDIPEEEVYSYRMGHRILHTVKVPLYDPAQQPQYLLCISEDITDRKQAEIALRNSEQRYAILTNNSPVGIFRTDAAGNCLYVNPKWCEFSDLTPVEAAGFGWMKTLHPEDRNYVITEWYRSAKEQTLFFAEYRVLRHDGSVIWLVGQAVAEKDVLGNITGYIGTITNITDLKQAEKELQRLNEELELRVQQRTQELQQQTNLLQTILDSMGDGVLVVNLNGSILLHNPAAEQLIGLDIISTLPSVPGLDFLGMSLSDSTSPDPINQIPVMQAIQGDITNQIEILLQNPSHPEGIYVEATIRPLMDSNSTIVGGVVVLRDVSDRKQSESALRQINAELEQRVALRTAELTQAKEAAEAANRAKSSFLANMSHELRTPLNAILGFSQLLNRNDDLTTEQLQQISIINRSGEHLLALINDILAMSKIEAGQVIVHSQAFDLYDLLTGLDDMFRLKADAKSLQLTIACDPHVPQYICTDKSKLRQVLINLLGNAIKFTQTGSVTLRVQVLRSLSSPETTNSQILPLQLIFEVDDTGPGINPQELDLLFEPFVQTQTGQQSQEGTGLGLPISRQFAQLLGGDLTVHSIPNAGSIFRCTLPVQVSRDCDVPPQWHSPKVLGLAPRQPSYRLLVVEDNQANRQFLVQLLQEIGFEVQEAHNGCEAIDIWQRWHPHLIWMDMRMPVMDGYEATRHIRALERSGEPQPPPQPMTCILALTASAFEDERDAILASGCDDLVRKPTTETLLLEKIADHLGVRYVYATPDPTAANTQSTNTSPYQLSIADMQVMSPQWLAKIHLAARSADDDLILQLLEEIPSTHTELARNLRNIVDELRLDKIIDLTHPDRIAE